MGVVNGHRSTGPETQVTCPVRGRSEAQKRKCKRTGLVGKRVKRCLFENKEKVLG